MSKYRFTDSIAWQKAQDLAVIIYRLFRESKDYGFRDQITRAVVSISNNIAEGFERNGSQEMKYFLGIAKGSCGEVHSMAHLARKLEYISTKDFQRIESLADEIAKIIYGFLKKRS